MRRPARSYRLGRAGRQWRPVRGRTGCGKRTGHARPARRCAAGAREQALRDAGTQCHPPFRPRAVRAALSPAVAVAGERADHGGQGRSRCAPGGGAGQECPPRQPQDACFRPLPAGGERRRGRRRALRRLVRTRSPYPARQCGLLHAALCEHALVDPDPARFAALGRDDHVRRPAGRAVRCARRGSDGRSVA